jgi:hemolysin III
MLLFILSQIILADGAGLYAETRINAWLKEPWNAISSLSFWLPVLYWSYKLRGKYHEHIFLTACMPLLFLGGLGSALFHAFRASYILLWLDVLPILLLFIALTIYFWQKILPAWWQLGGLTIGYMLFSWVLMNQINPSSVINVSYFLRGVALFLPAVLLLKRIQYKGAFLLIAAISWFVLALFFRTVDKEVWLLQYFAMGGHWIWHISAGIGAFYLAEFLYRLPEWEKNATIKH